MQGGVWERKWGPLGVVQQKTCHYVLEKQPERLLSPVVQSKPVQYIDILPLKHN